MLSSWDEVAKLRLQNTFGGSALAESLKGSRRVGRDYTLYPGARVLDAWIGAGDGRVRSC